MQLRAEYGFAKNCAMPLPATVLVQPFAGGPNTGPWAGPAVRV